MTNKTTSAIAHPNIALIKYWGKRDQALNLPATHSLSVTLNTLVTKTSVSFVDGLRADQVSVESQPADTLFQQRVSSCLSQLRELVNIDLFARVETSNNFPTAAGLASSASGFAALLTAANAALGSPLETRALALLARQASGSAARSLFSGYVIQYRGKEESGIDSFAEQLWPAEHWPLELLIAITSIEKKPVSSTKGMLHCAQTSPYWDAWIKQSDADIRAAIAAIKTRDFTALAEVSEASCLAMHAVMQASRPGLIYWNAATTELIHAVREMRASGLAVFFTIDAGPQLKAICLPEDAAKVAAQLVSVAGVKRIIRCQLGAGAQITSQ